MTKRFRVTIHLRSGSERKYERKYFKRLNDAEVFYTSMYCRCKMIYEDAHGVFLEIWNKCEKKFILEKFLMRTVEIKEINIKNKSIFY